MKHKPQIKKPTAQSSATSSKTAGQAAAVNMFESKYLHWVLIALLFFIVSIIYFPVAYQGNAPQASDITQWQGAAKSIIDYNKANADNALWTQNMFSGMPAYMISFPNRYPFLESLTKLTDKVINWRIFLLFIGGLGIFILLRQLRLGNWIAFFGAIAFIFSCHWVGLLEIGHNTKFRAIMYIPWVVWSLMYLRQKPGLLSLGLFATFLITQLRENHPQITYYLYLFIGMYWVFDLIQSWKAKELKDFGKWTALILIAFGLTALAVMNPYLSTMEYSHYTMRGGAEGLDKAYAQGWSFHPKEIIGFVIPDFWGGINQTYWGYMPFTQIYNYFGIVVLALGVLALWSKHRKLAILLWISSAIFTLMSFGSSTPALSDLFLKYLPMFNKFRVPSMILTMVQFNAVILAALGLSGIVDNIGNAMWQKRYLRIFWICGGIFILWIIGAKGVFSSLEFTTATEMARYQEAGAMSRLADLKAERLDILVKSGVLALLFLTVSMGLAYLTSAKKLKAAVFVFLITIISFFDLWVYTGKHLKDLYPAQARESHFQMRAYDQFLLNDTDNFRIYPFNTNQIRSAGEWAYYHQSVDGYSAAKLKRYDDILKVINGDGTQDGEFIRYLKGVFQEEGKEYPTPVLDMLATKYIIIPDSLPYGSMLQNIRPVYQDNQLTIYQNRDALPRAWFAKSTQVVPQAEDILNMLRKTDFNPRELAYLETEVPGLTAPDSSSVNQTLSEMHHLAYDVYSSGDALLVLSEVYYPAGWKAFVDGVETPLYPVNYILRGLKVPQGSHQVELRFAPESYSRSLILSLLGLGLTLLAVIGGIAYDRMKGNKAG